MKLKELVECSLSSWYPRFADVTIPTITLPIPPIVLQYLRSEGVMLPSDLEPGVEKVWVSFPGRGVGRWAVVEEAVEEWLGRVREGLGALGGSAFPKLNWSSPRDARWVATAHTLRCSSPEDVCLLLKASEFASFDLNEAEGLCEDAGPSGGVGMELNLRAWDEDRIQPATEFRAFVRNRTLLGISQRHCDRRFPSMGAEAERISNAISIFVEDKILPRLNIDSVVCDVFYTLRPGPSREMVMHLLDLNVWDEVTDSLLFAWPQLNSPDFAPSNPVELRTVDDDSLRTSSYDIYGLPIDVQVAESKDILALINGLSDGSITQDLTNGHHSDDPME